MSVIASLVDLYDHLLVRGLVPEHLGHSKEWVSGEILLDADGRIVDIRSLLVEVDGKTRPQLLSVPASIGRTSGIAPNLFWDKSEYVLGQTPRRDDKGNILHDAEGRPQLDLSEKVLKKALAFSEAHIAHARDYPEDAGLRALAKYCQRDVSADPLLDEALLDGKLVFRLEDDVDENGRARFLHERPAARALTLQLRMPEACPEPGQCAITGVTGPIARLHPGIRGVRGAQSSGASLVSFNAPAFTFNGKSQGANGPVSVEAVYKYSTALQAIVRPGSGHCANVSDLTLLFWSKAADVSAAMDMEGFLLSQIDTKETGGEDAAEKMRALAAGKSFGRLDAGSDMRVLILAPNAGRLSVVDYCEASFGAIAGRFARFREDFAMDAIADRPVAIWMLLAEIAAEGKTQHDRPLAASLLRSILTGAPYPQEMLTATLRRVRADTVVNARRAAICRAIANQKQGKDPIPMSLDMSCTDVPYLLGRMFCLLENIQKRANPSLKATIRDRWLSSAAATPMRVMPILIKGATHNLSKIRRSGSEGLAYYFDAQLRAIYDGLPINLPSTLLADGQARFIAGYYHQSQYRPEKADELKEELTE